MTSDESTCKLFNTIITAMKLAGEGHERHRHPKRPIVILGARAEKTARRLEEKEDPIDESPHLKEKSSNMVEGLEHNK